MLHNEDKTLTVLLKRRRKHLGDKNLEHYCRISFIEMQEMQVQIIGICVMHVYLVISQDKKLLIICQYYHVLSNWGVSLRAALRRRRVRLFVPTFIHNISQHISVSIRKNPQVSYCESVRDGPCLI
jgi:hypothetical protein